MRPARVRRLDGLRDYLLAIGGVLFQELRKLLVDDTLDETTDLRVAQLGLRLALELRIPQLHAENRHESLADVLAAEILLFLLEKSLGARVVVDGAGDRRPEAREVRASLVGVDVVREREDVVDVAGIPLHGQFDGVIVFFTLEMDDLGWMASLCVLMCFTKSMMPPS